MVDTGHRVVGLWVDVKLVSRPCCYVVHLESETELVDAQLVADATREAVAQDDVAQLHIVGRHYVGIHILRIARNVDSTEITIGRIECLVAAVPIVEVGGRDVDFALAVTEC